MFFVSFKLQKKIMATSMPKLDPPPWVRLDPNADLYAKFYYPLKKAEQAHGYFQGTRPWIGDQIKEAGENEKERARIVSTMVRALLKAYEDNPNRIRHVTVHYLPGVIKYGQMTKQRDNNAFEQGIESYIGDIIGHYSHEEAKDLENYAKQVLKWWKDLWNVQPIFYANAQIVSALMAAKGNPNAAARLIIFEKNYLID